MANTTELMHSVLWSGIYLHEGHYVSFRILEDDTVVVKEILERSGHEHSSEKIYDIDKALDYQKQLINFGYEQIGGLYE